MRGAALLASSTLRAPRLRVLANGAPLGGVTEAIVTSTGSFGADRFRVTMAEAANWTAAASIAVDVQMALSPLGGFVSLIQGMADLVEFDPLRGTVGLEGRDMSAALMEAPTQEIFANRTASEIASALAARHGLAADVQATSTPVGRYWELEHDSLTLNTAGRTTTEWDLLVTLAQQEGFDLSVSGGALHFRAAVAAPPSVLPVASLSRLRLERALTFAGDIVVTVKSWHSRAGAGCVQTARTQRGAASSRNYVYVAPNLTQEAALALAQRRLAELLGHELVLAAEMPGELALTPRGLVELQGSNSIFDTVYRVGEIERRLHFQDGFSQSIRARASSGDA